MSDVFGNPPEGPHPSDPTKPAGQPPVYGVPPSGPHPVAPPSPYHHNPYGAPGYGRPSHGGLMRDPDVRPGTVLAAAIVTMISTGLVLTLLAGALFFLLVSRADFMQGVGDEVGVTGSGGGSWSTGILVVLLVFIVWCVAVLVLAVLALRRSNAARIMLVVSSALTALFSLAIGNAVAVIPVAAAIATIVLLFTGGAGDWYRREHLYSQPQLPQH